MSDHPFHYLAIKNLEIDGTVLQLLPTEIALRYHAVPVAWDGKRITIAMENPGDESARQAVIKAAGDTTCIVQADTNLLAPILARLEKAHINHKDLRILLWSDLPDENPQNLTYAQGIAGLLEARLDLLETKTSNAAGLTLLYQAASPASPDLLLYSGQLAARVTKQLIQRLPTSLLILRSPRLPINSVLLLLHNQAADLFALEWCLQLAKASAARITLMPLVLAVPGMLTPSVQHTLPDLLSSNCPLGCQLRDFSRRLVQAGIQGTIRLRQEMPEEQIIQEIGAQEYDLVVSGLAVKQKSLLPFLQTLLQSTRQPLLLARTNPDKTV